MDSENILTTPITSPTQSQSAHQYKKKIMNLFTFMEQSPWKLTVAQLAKKIPAVYRTQRYTAMPANE
jgi:hypothetical protein